MSTIVDKIVILCVDDEPNVLGSLKTDLRRSLGPSYLVETAESGQETLVVLSELLEEGYEVAVVIVDYIMPGMKGDELLKQVHQKIPNAINIMLSGQADIDAVARSIEHAKLYRFMAKPWRSEDLTLTAQQALHSYENDRAIERQNVEIYQLNAELTRINQNLENTVQERTLQLQATVKELQILSQLKDDFLHAVSHDLRTPVAGMLMILRRLQHKTIAEPTNNLSVALSRELLDSLVQGGERQLKLLETLVEAHFSEIHGIPIAKEPINFPRYLQTIARDFTNWVSDPTTRVTVSCPEALPIVAIDPLQIRRIYENVISNACKYNRPGIEITLTAIQKDQSLYCTIQDNGVGMPNSECQQLFERYARGGARAQRSVGLGLGLFLCRQIIQEHGGEINATSAPDEGLTIWFTLPIG